MTNERQRICPQSGDGKVDVEIELDDDVIASLTKMAEARGCTIDDIANEILKNACREAFIDLVAEIQSTHATLLQDLS
jgi:hypothetical protein